METEIQADSGSTKPKKVESETRSPRPTPTRFLLVPHPNPSDSRTETVPPTDFSTDTAPPTNFHPDLNHPNQPLRPRKLGFVFCALILILLTTQFASNIAQTKYFADLVEIESHLEYPPEHQPLATCVVNNKSKTLTLICKNAETRQYSLRHLDLDTCGFGG